MKRKYILPLLLVIQIILVKTLGLFPDFIEEYYSRGWYPKIAFVSRSVFGSIPFSVGDIFYLILIILLIRWIFKNRKGFFRSWKNNALQFLGFLSVFYFFFHLLWGMNYYRIPLDEKLKIDKEYTIQELENFTLKMIAKTNALQFEISKNTTKKVVIPYNDEQIYKLAANGYLKLPENLREFEHPIKSTKNSLFSFPLSYMGFGGYMNPFTNEAQVNNLKPKYDSPMTTCHEMAHQTGIGSESECNFIGFITATKNDDLYFQYAAYTSIVRYCFRNLEYNLEGSSEKYLPLLNKGVLANFAENKAFWESYSTPIETFFEIFYDNFLKINDQKDGLEGYSKFVGLMIGYEKAYVID